ncbi:MAG: M23 family metallopeptidase, partial [Geminicoccaceae bacterium]|nr:M23 family metallopeptidase [Geminicoccaceae bacterium]
MSFIRRIQALCVYVFLLGLSAAAAAHEPPVVELGGDAVQGGLMTGRVAPGSEVELDGRPLMVDPTGRFLFGFGRDAGTEAELVIRHAEGPLERRRLTIEPRRFDVQRIDGLPPSKVTPRTAEELARIRDDARAISRARARESALDGAFERPRWPTSGPITGVFGSQRILNGEPRSPHKGVDVAAPRGAPVGAIAGGTVTLAERDMYFTGHTVMIDHGHGLHSIYAHLDSLAVQVGDEVAVGQTIGRVGSTGRATGPHLHFG